jgi:AraC-like DNA-binding protein
MVLRWVNMVSMTVFDPPIAPLGEALRCVQVSGVFYCPSELSEPWGVELPPMDDCVWFHAVIEGTCTLEVDGRTQEIRAGDLIVIPHGSGHRAWGAEPAPTPSVFDLPHDHVNEQYAVLRHGGGGAMTRLVCGGVRLHHPAARQLIDALPAVIHTEPAGSARSDWIWSTLELIAEETRTVRPGGEAVVSRLCDIVVIQAIRSWMERDPSARVGWLGALRDPQVGGAIAAIHADPAGDWTVASLAEVAAMSRSAFSSRFTDLVGESAMRYVARWRMAVAADLLADGNATVAGAAAAVGYDSEAAFSRAFKRVTGANPRESKRSRTG